MVQFTQMSLNKQMELHQLHCDCRSDNDDEPECKLSGHKDLHLLSPATACCYGKQLGQRVSSYGLVKYPPVIQQFAMEN